MEITHWVSWCTTTVGPNGVEGMQFTRGCAGPKVGPSIWLGVAWVVDPVNNQNPDHAGALQPVIDALKPLENATYKGVLEAIGVQGPNSSPETSGLTMPEPVSSLLLV